MIAKTGEKTGGIVVKTDAMIVVTRVKTVTKTVYAKALKMPAPDGVQIRKRKAITEEPEAKTINAKDRLIEPDFFKVTEKVTIETFVQTAIAAGINK
jgi:hypothetical protein